MTNVSITQAADSLRHLISEAVTQLRGDPRTQSVEYAVAFLASESALLDHLVVATQDNPELAPFTRIAAGSIIASAANRLTIPGLGVDVSALDNHRGCTIDANSTEAIEAVMGRPVPTLLNDDLQLLSETFFQFGQETIAPKASEVHRLDLDLPEEIISGLARLDAFGMSVPNRYGGSLDLAGSLPMIVATEQLSRASLAIGGSLLTRPEILVRAVVDGGTPEQQQRWLPRIAAGDAMIAVAVTEPDHGSNVADIRTSARRDGDTWILSGTKTWSTFAGRAELLMVLARTDPDASLGHRGLSLFVVEKPAQSGHEFSLGQPGGGTMVGRSIRTVGYRGLHTFEVTLDDWAVPTENLIGLDGGLGRGFHLQMGAFAGGRLQTAARAVGLMQAAIDTATDYASERVVFGEKLIDQQLTRAALAKMISMTLAYRLNTYRVAALLDEGQGQIEASMVKALACRAAESISRSAMQLHGGYGYAEEYEISRIWQDARVLSIFEGTEEVLALKVIAKRLLA